MNLITQLIEFLSNIPNTETFNGRKALIYQTGISKYTNRIKWDGTTLEFFTGLLSFLIQEGPTALFNFLENLEKSSILGYERQQELSEIRVRIQKLTPVEWQKMLAENVFEQVDKIAELSEMLSDFLEGNDSSSVIETLTETIEGFLAGCGFAYLIERQDGVAKTGVHVSVRGVKDSQVSLLSKHDSVELRGDQIVFHQSFSSDYPLGGERTLEHIDIEWGNASLRLDLEVDEARYSRELTQKTIENFSNLVDAKAVFLEENTMSPTFIIETGNTLENTSPHAKHDRLTFMFSSKTHTDSTGSYLELEPNDKTEFEIPLFDPDFDDEEDFEIPLFDPTTDDDDEHDLFKPSIIHDDDEEDED